MIQLQIMPSFIVDSMFVYIHVLKLNSSVSTSLEYPPIERALMEEIE
jgi:hypothetical protein